MHFWSLLWKCHLSVLRAAWMQQSFTVRSVRNWYKTVILGIPVKSISMQTMSKLWIINFISLLLCTVSQWAFPAKEAGSGLYSLYWCFFTCDSGLPRKEPKGRATDPQCFLLAFKAATSMAYGASQTPHQTSLLTWPLCSLLLLNPVVICWVVSVIRKGYPRPRDADAGVPIVVITHPSPREIRGSPGFCKLAHSAGGHSIVALRRHICRIPAAPKEEQSILKLV